MQIKKSTKHKDGRPWYLYILVCNDGTLYTGVSPDVLERIKKHIAGKGAVYTRQRGVSKLVHVEELPTQSAALRREHEIKKWTRQSKLDFINGKLLNPKYFHIRKYLYVNIKKQNNEPKQK
ncbi:MAG TPA: GIY-YIG nuclease family protein [Patescibacteria group bacterium]|jgi:putative endonuclease|nr:GIY-YIG nuclease family protein [Patescibacteria group bacterium]